MQLHPDWKRITTRAWSVRFIALAALFSAGEVTLPVIQPYVNINPIWLGLGAGISSGAAFFSRIVAQKEFEDIGHGA
jgi:hypothetical protein